MDDQEGAHVISEPYYHRVNGCAPDFLSSFDTKTIRFSEMDCRKKGVHFEDSPNYVLRQIVCKCGEEKLYLWAPRNKFHKWVLSGSYDFCQPLILIACPKCESKSTTFDQRVHGWDAIFGKEIEIDMRSPKIYNKKPSEIYFGLSYDWLTYYDRVMSEFDIGDDLENHVDHIDVFMRAGKYVELNFKFLCGTWDQDLDLPR